MCAWDTREETLHAFVADLKTELQMARGIVNLSDGDCNTI